MLPILIHSKRNMIYCITDKRTGTYKFFLHYSMFYVYSVTSWAVSLTETSSGSNSRLALENSGVSPVFFSS